jgi:hypothetical protein
MSEIKARPELAKTNPTLSGLFRSDELYRIHRGSEIETEKTMSTI